jgi:hypothetical protein
MTTRLKVFECALRGIKLNFSHQSSLLKLASLPLIKGFSATHFLGNFSNAGCPPFWVVENSFKVSLLMNVVNLQGQ